MEHKKSWLMITVLAGCVLILLLHKSARVVENGPLLIHLDTPNRPDIIIGDRRLLENLNRERTTKSPMTHRRGKPLKSSSKMSVADLLSNALQELSASTGGQEDGLDADLEEERSESSIADIWREEEDDNGTWRIFEEEYQALEWKVNREGFNRWRSDLEMYGVDSRNSFLITHDSVEVKQVLPFYLSTQQQYKVSEFFMSLIPKSSPYDEKTLGRCAVVGNSGNLKDSGCGKTIDSADYVFRCNIPPLYDFEDDVGLKTNLTTMNPSMLDTKEYGTIAISRDLQYPYNMVLQPYNGVILLPCFSHYFYLRRCIKAIKQYYLKNANMTFLHPENFISIWEYWKDHHMTNLPSTGFYIINVAATLCDSVDVYGFWPFDKTALRTGRQEHVMYHYYEEGTWRPVHDMVGEFAQLFQLHRDGVLRMHLGNCTSWN